MAIAVVLTAGIVAAAAVRPVEESAIEEAVPELMAFVEETRGLRFVRTVPVSLVDDDEFERELPGGRQGLGSERGASQFVAFLRALGLDDDVDPGTVGEAARQGVAGFYDARRDRLYLRGVDPSPFVRLVLVHELTHALDDQHFDLERRNVKDTAELNTAFGALAEGSATAVERKYFETRSPAEPATIRAEGGGGGDQGDGLPSAVKALFSFPYQAGAAFVTAIERDGGTAALDRAYKAPPTTTEHILHPDRYLRREAAKQVDAPVADGQRVDGGVLGELWVNLVMRSVLPRQEGASAAEGWGGDRYVAWADGSRLCIRWQIVMDTPADTAQLLAGLQKWAARNPGATVAGRGPVVITNCA